MNKTITTEQIFTRILKTFDGVIEDKNWGERGLFYNPGHVLPKGVYILTVKERDGPNDKASNVDRSGVFRLNLGISKAAFVDLFGSVPARPPAGTVVATGHDFTQLDLIMPHPVYGWMSWIGVLNPSEETFQTLMPLITEAVDLARKKYRKRLR